MHDGGGPVAEVSDSRNLVPRMRLHMEGPIASQRFFPALYNVLGRVPTFSLFFSLTIGLERLKLDPSRPHSAVRGRSPIRVALTISLRLLSWLLLQPSSGLFLLNVDNISAAWRMDEAVNPSNIYGTRCLAASTN